MQEKRMPHPAETTDGVRMKDDGSGYRFLPYKADFAVMKRWRTVGTAMLYGISVLSVLIPLFRELATSMPMVFIRGMEFVNFMLIVAYYIVNVVSEVFLYPAAARQRRLNFIDNSLGSRFLGKDSYGYFSNDEISTGPFKLAVNCFENLFFTYNIAKAMRRGIAARNAVLAGVFLTFAYIGIQNNSVGLPVVQIFLSSLFLTELIHHLHFVAKLSVLLDKFKMFFMEAMKERGERSKIHYPISLLLEYETTLAYNKAPTSDRIYAKIKDRLSEEWDELKDYYQVAQLGGEAWGS
jgi:hypothetical protein